MDFELSKEQKAIQKAARDFAEGEFDRDLAMEYDQNHKFPFDLWKKACKLGFVGMHFPEEFGGQGYGIFENVLVIEEFCRRDIGFGVAVVIPSFGTEMILRFGTDEQKARYLPAVVAGEAISAAAFTEPDHGSDITSVSTTALREGDEYVVNGTKIFISNGSIANFVVVLCQTNPDARPPHRGMSIILVETDRVGFEATEIGAKMGFKMTSTAQLNFNGVRVPVSNLVGQENRGFHQAVEFFDETRIEVAAQAVGAAQGAFERALDYAKRRKQFGRRLADFQAIQHKLAEMATKIETARLITYKAAWTFDSGKLDPRLSSMAKLYAARAALEVCEEAIQIFGGAGYMLENEVERYYRDVRVLDILEGAREIQKNTIAAILVGREE
ncbi:MAG: acyl-CoA dehydrogenase family protein [Chloroflexi bacterium]|nr:acyl-CoA dehydrogenase family protein [Chloroflexota bacterium]